MICLAGSHLRLYLSVQWQKLWYPARTLPSLTLTHILFSGSEGPGLLCGTRGRLKWVLYFLALLLPLSQTLLPCL